MFDCPFLYSDTFTPFCLEGWNRVPSCWGFILGRSKSQTRSFTSASVIKCRCTVLYDEKTWSSLVLVPASVGASFNSGSESRVFFSRCSGTGRYMFYNKCSFLRYRPLSQILSVIEQLCYRILIQQRQVYKDHPSFLEGGNWCRPVTLEATNWNRIVMWEQLWHDNW